MKSETWIIFHKPIHNNDLGCIIHYSLPTAGYTADAYLFRFWVVRSSSTSPISRDAMTGANLRPTLLRAGVALVIAALLAVFCYAFVDRPVAFYVHDHDVSSYRVLKWLTLVPPWVQAWSPLVLALLVVRRAWSPFSKCEKVLFVSLVSLLVADQFRTSLGDIFGRYWPETWFDHNPSLIGNGTYGFHPFQHGDDIGSFPSGHAARILGFSWVWWLAMPRSRPLLAMICGPMLASLVLMNYHFVGDVVTGSVLGAVVANCAWVLAEPPIAAHVG
jgi:membrane-associated phospholipid phosphatase